MSVRSLSPSLRGDYLTPAETAELVRVSPKTLANWRWQGIGPAFTKLTPGRSGRIRYHRSSVETYLAGDSATAA